MKCNKIFCSVMLVWWLNRWIFIRYFFSVSCIFIQLAANRLSRLTCWNNLLLSQFIILLNYSSYTQPMLLKCGVWKYISLAINRTQLDPVGTLVRIHGYILIIVHVKMHLKSVDIFKTTLRIWLIFITFDESMQLPIEEET